MNCKFKGPQGQCLLSKTQVTDEFCLNQCNPKKDYVKLQMLKTHFNLTMDLGTMVVKERPKIGNGQLIVLDNQEQLVNEEEAAKQTISVLLPSCNEENNYLKQTIVSLLKNAKEDIEILVGLDGGNEESVTDSRVITEKFPERIGKRKVLNRLAKIAKGNKFFILDSHCGITPGWDKVLKRYHPHNSLLQCTLDGMRTIEKDGTPCWRGKGNRYDFCSLTSDLKDKWWLGYHTRLPKNWKVTETMGITGCGLLLDRELFNHLGGYIEEFGQYRGAEGPEWACKVWLSGGRVLLIRDVTVSHVFKKNTPYKYSVASLRESYAKIKACFYGMKGPNQIFPPQFIADRFAPVPYWDGGKEFE